VLFFFISQLFNQKSKLILKYSSFSV